MNLEQLTGQKIFNADPETFGKVHIDISKRAYDGMYTIWQLMWPFFVDGSWLNIEKEVGGIEYCKFFEKHSSYLGHTIWVPVAILHSKAKATKYCRDRFGRHCFKDNDNVVIAFT